MTELIVEPAEFLKNWLNENQKQLEQFELKPTLNEGGPIDNEKYSAHIDLDSETKIGRLVLWNTGDAFTEVFSLVGEEEPVFIDNRTLVSLEELDQLLDKFIHVLLKA